MENNLIGISGQIKSGKDLLTNIIQYVYWKKRYINPGVTVPLFEDTNVFLIQMYENRKFADTIKDTLCLWLGCTREDLENREFKETPLGKEWWHYKLKSGAISPIWHYADKVHNATCKECYLVKPTPRLFLQLLGTQAGRQLFHPNIWVNILISRYKSDQKWIISDVRFPNEVKAIKDKGGVVVRIHRPSILTNGQELHESETALDNYNNFDHTFINDGSIEDLVKKVEQWLH